MKLVASAATATGSQTSLEGRTAVLVDSHPLWLEALTRLVERIGLCMVATASTSADALAAVVGERPDLVITEMKLRGEGPEGLTWLTQARELQPELKAIVLSRYEDASHVDAAFEAGAVAYVVKTAEPEDLASAIRQAFDHSVYIGRAVPATMVPARRSEDDSPGLTKREVEILRLVAEGHSNSELARMLWVTEQTVKFHLSNVYRKLNVPNRTAASRWAQANGFLVEPAGDAAAG